MSGLELERFIPLFHQHDIKFEQFLFLTMENLECIGIDQLGARKRILKAVSCNVLVLLNNKRLAYYVNCKF